MELNLRDFRKYYQDNRGKMHLKFCRPLIESEFNNPRLDNILMFYSGLVGFISLNKLVTELKPGITNELTNLLFSDVLPLEDMMTYSKEQILQLEGIPNGKIALGQSLNVAYIDNHFKVLAYGVVTSHPIANNKFCVMLHMTNSTWAIFINSLAEIIGDESKVITVYKPELPAYLYYMYTDAGVEVRAEMIEDRDFRIYFFPSTGK